MYLRMHLVDDFFHTIFFILKNFPHYNKHSQERVYIPITNYIHIQNTRNEIFRQIALLVAEFNRFLRYSKISSSFSNLLGFYLTR